MKQTERSDRVRQIVVVVMAVVALVVALIGSGRLGGTPIQEAAGGAFAADATVLTPAGPAFAIWGPIYLGLLGYALWQVFPGQRAKPLHRSVGYGIAASLLLNAVWIACVLAGRIVESFVIIVVLLLVLLLTFVRICRRTGRGTIAQAVLVDGVVGLYLGWITVATAANLAAWLAAGGASGWAQAPGGVALLGLVGAALVALFTAWRGGRWAPAIATAWGLVWMAVARWTIGPDAPLIAASALVVAVLILVCAAGRFIVRVRGAVERSVPDEFADERAPRKS